MGCAQQTFPCVAACFNRALGGCWQPLGKRLCGCSWTDPCACAAGVPRAAQLLILTLLCMLVWFPCAEHLQRSGWLDSRVASTGFGHCLCAATPGTTWGVPDDPCKHPQHPNFIIPWSQWICEWDPWCGHDVPSAPDELEPGLAPILHRTSLQASKAPLTPWPRGRTEGIPTTDWTQLHTLHCMDRAWMDVRTWTGRRLDTVVT